MNTRRGSHSVRLFLFFAAAVLILAGCLPSPTERPDGEPVLKPVTESGQPGDPGPSGQEGASIQLTDQGRRHLAAGQVDQAVSVLQKAISIFPKNPYAYYYLAQTRFLKKEYSQSLPPLEQAELLIPADRIWLSRIHSLRGQVYEGLSRFEEARSEYRRALSNDTRNSEALAGLGRIALPQGEPPLGSF